ncbi:MAG: hypothetical protein K2N87_20485 [Eubacterium sp.]|nr:hypothetical protein [Eubacterium sp.]
MSSEIVVLVFDIIILILGADALFSALRMKKTGIPSAILIPKQEQSKIKNREAFCDKMYQPTILFGIMICLYGIMDMLNNYVIRIMYVDLISIVCFLIVCAWYVKKLREVKEAHM